MTQNAEPKSDTLPPGPGEQPSPRTQQVDRKKSVLGLHTLRELRHVTGIEAHELAARMGRRQAAVEAIESLDLELLEVSDLIDYVQGLGMTICISVELRPQVPLNILHTTP